MFEEIGADVRVYLVHKGEVKEAVKDVNSDDEAQ
jgi:hypothetical protein